MNYELKRCLNFEMTVNYLGYYELNDAASFSLNLRLYYGVIDLFI